MKLLATFLSLAVAVFAAADARAQSRIESIRVGSQPDYDRLVFDLGESVDVGRLSEDGADELVIQLDVRPPLSNAKLDDKLAELGVFVEESDNGSTVRVLRDGRSVRAFKLPPAAGKSSDRMVVDISKGTRGGAFAIPDDADPVPFRGGNGGAPKARQTAEKPREEKRAEKPAPREEEVEVAQAERPKPTPKRETPREEPRPEPAEKAEKPREKATPPVSAKPTPSEKLPADPSSDPNEIWVTVRAISIEGVGGASPSQDELLALEVEVSPVQGGFVEPRNDLPVERIPLFKLAGEDRAGRKVNGGVLQLIVETIASAYSDLGKLGTRVDIRQSDLEKLIAPESDGELVIRVQESAARRS
jgi:hypothetical protein